MRKIAVFALACALTSCGTGTLPSTMNGVIAGSLLPLAPRKSWTYSLTALSIASPCPTGTYTQSITTVQLNVVGRTAYTLPALCPGDSDVQYSTSGTGADVLYLGRWVTGVPALPIAGSTYSGGDRSFTFTPVTSITVPAGTYTNCWQRQDLSTQNSYAIFCPGVGIVLNHHQDSFGNGWDAQLTATRGSDLHF